VGLPRLTGFEDQLGHRARPLRGGGYRERARIPFFTRPPRRRSLEPMEITDLRERRDESLLRAVHDDLYVRSFPLEEERETLDYWLSALWGDGAAADRIRAHALVAGTDLEDPRKRQIAGLAFSELYRESGCGLLSYLAVDPHFRRGGVARKLVDRTLETLRRDTEEQGATLAAVFAEIHDPDAVEQLRHDDVMDPAERASVFAKLGARRVPIRYVQPALDENGQRARALQLVVLGCAGELRSLPAAAVREFLVGLYTASEGPPAADDAEFKGMVDGLGSGVVRLAPLNAVEEDASFEVTRYGVAFEFVTRSAPTGPLPRAGEQFASFERDLLSHAFRDRGPFASTPIHVPDACRQVEVQFAPELRFVSEGRTCTLVAEGAPIEGHRVCVQVRASKTEFRTGITVWHLVLTPRPDLRHGELTEYDVIRLAKLWAGGEQLLGPYPGDGPETTVRFVRGDQTWTPRQLAHAVIGDEIENVLPRGGIVQLITDDRPGGWWKQAWKVIREAKDEPPIDTSFPFRNDEQRRFVESIAGVIQALVDFREIDDAELRDVFTDMDVGEDGLQGIHKGTLVYMAASDRTWDVGKMSYGISPYLLLPHALLLHNEEVLRDATRAVQEERDAVDELARAREELGRALGRDRWRRPVRSAIAALRAARTAALAVRRERRKLRDVREDLHGALERDYLPNVFHYPNERRIYEAGESSRGLAALSRDVRESLNEFDARWEGGSSMRRTMADDLKAGLLFVIAGFALKDYLDPVALAVIFGIGGLAYVAFRFYTWR
jgi:GNAT superfamily N-acetyltransferase